VVKGSTEGCDLTVEFEFKGLALKFYPQKVQMMKDARHVFGSFLNFFSNPRHVENMTRFRMMS